MLNHVCRWFFLLYFSVQFIITYGNKIYINSNYNGTSDGSESAPFKTFEMIYDLSHQTSFSTISNDAQYIFETKIILKYNLIIKNNGNNNVLIIKSIIDLDCSSFEIIGFFLRFENSEIMSSMLKIQNGSFLIIKVQKTIKFFLIKIYFYRIADFSF